MTSDTKNPLVVCGNRQTDQNGAARSVCSGAAGRVVAADEKPRRAKNGFSID
jgi:hypothetical protein